MVSDAVGAKYWCKEARERYQRYLQSDAWKAKRKAVLQASGFRCRRCGAPATEVHHETYKRIYNERMSDLTALCSKCHEAAHSKKIRIPDQDPPPKTNNARVIANARRKQKTAPLTGSGTIVGDGKVKGTRPLDNSEIRWVSTCFTTNTLTHEWRKCEINYFCCLSVIRLLIQVIYVFKQFFFWFKPFPMDT